MSVGNFVIFRFIDSIPPLDSKRRSLEKTMAKIGIKNFFLNWSNISPSFENYYWTSEVFSMRENDYFIQIQPREWDSCIYLDVVSPATPHPLFKVASVIEK